MADTTPHPTADDADAAPDTTTATIIVLPLALPPGTLAAITSLAAAAAASSTPAPSPSRCLYQHIVALYHTRLLAAWGTFFPRELVPPGRTDPPNTLTWPLSQILTVLDNFANHIALYHEHTPDFVIPSAYAPNVHMDVPMRLLHLAKMLAREEALGLEVRDELLEMAESCLMIVMDLVGLGYDGCVEGAYWRPSRREGLGLMVVV
ncbi:hypothetical protein EDC01DRAFT_777402 [Geopyxis carbonaria]|nr:hypothetical protein EDC01DRAFT_777402 [Geopyxis carbonaria]